MYTERCKRSFFVQATDFVYEQVINDLLDPLGQNLRVREDGQVFGCSRLQHCSTIAEWPSPYVCDSSFQ